MSNSVVRDWLIRWLRQRVWHYVGMVEGRTTFVEETTRKHTGEVAVGYWVLEERGDGTRRYQKIGDPCNSPYAVAQHAAVVAWKAGGPVPKLVTQAPTRPKLEAKLLAFPGGKESA